MKEKLFFLAFTFTLCFLFGQEKKDDAVTEELLENIYLHLNKTTFLQGERLWFKAYVLNQSAKLPALGTTNLHVGLYNNNGEKVKRKLFYVENGMAQGDFAIDSTLVDSEYTVVAWTNYMRNFKELEPFRQSIRILGDREEGNPGEVDMKISIYPEGGSLIAGAYNNIGILVDNGLGQGVSVDNLELVDGTGKVIRSNITTNSFGMGKVGVVVEAGNSYYFQRERPGLEMVRSKLPLARVDKLGLNIENNGKDQVLLKLLASREAFDTKDGDVHTVAIYQDDFVLLEDLEVNEEEAVISIARDRLPFGVLTAVLFDSELRPMAHRMFFNHSEKADPQLNLEVEYCFTEFGDSIQLDLILPKGIEEEANVSLSALPWGSLAHNPDNSVVSAFTLRPYTGQSFQDGYFFQQQDRKKRFELDKRLLIEGWGKYDWDSRKLEEVTQKFEMENGISFQGKVIDANLIEENQISLVAELSGELKFKELQSDKSFKGSMILFQDDSLGIALIGKQGKLRKPRVEAKFLSNEPLSWTIPKTFYRTNRKNNEPEVNQPLNIGERTIVLEEVTVVDRAIITNKTDMFVPQGTLFPISEGRIIGDTEIKKYNSVLSYLMTLGYKRSRAVDSDGFFVDVLLNPKDNKPVAFNPAHINLPLSRVQAIYFDVDKKVYVSVALRSRPYESPEERNKFLKLAIRNGYARPQEYFAPVYPDYDGFLFKSYGAVDWRANISVTEEIPTSITIPLKGQRVMQLYVEGMSQDGSLISRTEQLNLDRL